MRNFILQIIDETKTTGIFTAQRLCEFFIY